jgi:hypothetical protein
MYGSTHSKMHPITELLLWFAWSTGFAWACIGSIRQGSFRWGRFGGGVQITSEADPVHFWSVVIATAVMAVVGYVVAARIFIRYLRERT